MKMPGQRSARRRYLGLGTVVVLAAALLAFGAGTGVASQGSTKAAAATPTINYGYVNWSEDVANTYIATAVLTKAGYTVHTTLADVGPVFAGLASGSLDFFSEAWLPHTHASYWKQYGSKLQRIRPVYAGQASLGIAVPNYCKTANYTQLNAQASRYGGKIIGIDPGAGEMQETQRAIKAYKMSNITLVPGSEAAMEAALAKAYKAHQCIAVPLWQPLWVWSVYKMHYLKDPKNLYPPDHVYIVAPKGIQKQFPGAYKFFKAYHLSLPDVDKIMLELHKGKDAHKVVASWMASHRKLVNHWVALAKS